MRVLVTGCAGFVGSHLTEHLVNRGDTVYGIDNLLTGQEKNIGNLHSFIEADISKTNDMKDIIKQIINEGPIDLIYNLACPASPDHYIKHSLKTLDTCYLGTKNILDAAFLTNSMVIHTSTSEVYGNPDHSPQEEDYYGSVNSFGPRACYDEGKRVAEALIYEYIRLYRLDIKIARLFNTYGPRMAINDGRVISNFICAALENRELLLYGNGLQSRSFCYVSDTIHALLGLAETTKLNKPVNIGNPDEKTIYNIAELIIAMTDSKSGIMAVAHKKDDPLQRCPNIERINMLLNWKPEITLTEGLKKTIEYFRKCLIKKTPT
tara:strand:- start:5641 stop:6603 length:963 start_codon:yes stop_codon:yes gene_type:complete